MLRDGEERSVRSFDAQAGVDGQVFLERLFMIVESLDKTFQLAFPLETPK